jgi:hypothetical protein
MAITTFGYRSGYDMSPGTIPAPKIGWFTMLAAVAPRSLISASLGTHTAGLMTPEFEQSGWVMRFNVVPTSSSRPLPGGGFGVRGIVTWPTWAPRRKSSGIFIG